MIPSEWESEGLVSWDVVQLPEGQDYQVQAIMRWTSLESFEKAFAGPSASKIVGDVPNFTTAKPVVFKGVVKSSSG